MLQKLAERIEKIGTNGYTGILRLFWGTPYQMSIIRLMPEDGFTIHLPHQFSRWPIENESARDALQWVIDVKRRAMRDDYYLDLAGISDILWREMQETENSHKD